MGMLMGTDRNKEFLDSVGFLDQIGREATGSDLILFVESESLELAERTLAAARTRLQEYGDVSRSLDRIYLTLDAAVRQKPNANIACISIPGKFAANVANEALDKGLHVFLFSDNVSVEEEVRLKEKATRLGLLVMGPGCGTTFLAGKGIGFANCVRRGAIGIVGASGTGIQGLSVHFHRAGLGISHAIGTGGRDLSLDVGGLTTSAALRLLADDEGTEAIVLVSKPADPTVTDRILREAINLGKPIFAVLLGDTIVLKGELPNSIPCFSSIDALLPTLFTRLGRGLPYLAKLETDETDTLIEALERISRQNQRSLIRAGFTGGSLAAEAFSLLRQAGLNIESNLHLPESMSLQDSADLHQVIDFGSEEFTEGRAHPMANPDSRNRWLADQASQIGSAGILLADLVLGYGSHPNPAQALVEVMRPLFRMLKPPPLILCSVCGLDEDPQVASAQTSLLRSAGILVAPSNAAAARIAASCAKYGNDSRK